MNWVDVAGAPGSGKSELCYRHWPDKWPPWDGKLPAAYWRPFCDEIATLCTLVQDHISRDPKDRHVGQPTIGRVAGMNTRSAQNFATAERMVDERTYFHSGLVQRILGFGWRLHEMGRDINLIRTALWRMPVSVGVAFLEADLQTLLHRNREREKNPQTRHENRSHQVPHMLAVIPLAKEVLQHRGIPWISIDVQTQSVDSARAQLLAFAGSSPCHAASFRSGCEMETVRVVPPWFIRS